MMEDNFMEIVEEKEMMDPCYGIEGFKLRRSDIVALLQGKYLYHGVNADEYAIYLYYDDSDIHNTAEFVLTDDGFTAKRDPLLDYISCGTFYLDDYVKLKEKEVKKEMSDYMLELEEACNTLVNNCRNSRCSTCLFGPTCKLTITPPSEWPVDKIFEKEDLHE